jgi:hypothetical protein
MPNIFSVVHSMPRHSAANADAICDRVNNVTASNGDSLSKEMVQQELDSLASKEMQDVYGMRIVAHEHDVEDDV